MNYEIPDWFGTLLAWKNKWLPLWFSLPRNRSSLKKSHANVHLSRIIHLRLTRFGFLIWTPLNTSSVRSSFSIFDWGSFRYSIFFYLITAWYFLPFTTIWEVVQKHWFSRAIKDSPHGVDIGIFVTKLSWWSSDAGDGNFTIGWFWERDTDADSECLSYTTVFKVWR